MVSGGFNFNTNQTNNVSCKSWLLSAKIWDLIEVAETYTLASGGFESDRGQNEKKILGKNSEIANFWLTET
jgi:hypothetical protein